MNCVIVDDDPTCISALEGIIKSYCPQLQIRGAASDISAAVKLINGVHPDVVFLDVEIGAESGFDLFSYFSDPGFEVVFTTAHEKYALKAIKSSCFDFLLKPINTQELVNVVGKLEKEKKKTAGKNVDVLLDNLKVKDNILQKIAIPSNDGYVFVSTNDIVCLEADGKYTKIETRDGSRSLSTKNIGEFEELLNGEQFFRTHKSWIINLSCVKKYLKNENRVLLNNNSSAEVSSRKKDEFLKLFDRA
jgi:two-component system, LytTR family, response regulator